MIPLVEAENVAFTYPHAPGGRAFGVSGLTFDVGDGEILGVIGPNSAGKTTLVRLLSKVLEPERGTIRLDGAPLSSLSRWEVARKVASVPQDLPLAFPFTVAELALMGRYPHRPHGFFESARDHEIARQAMEATGVLGLAGQAVEALSGGERQRAVLARALAQEPRLLILDEPTAHLDLRYQVETAELLRRLNRDCGVTIILVSHDLNLAAELSDRLLLISEGRVRMIGAPERVIDEEALESVYGCPVRVGRNPESGRPNVQLIWREKPEEVVHDD